MFANQIDIIFYTCSVFGWTSLLSTYTSSILSHSTSLEDPVLENIYTRESSEIW